MMSVGCAGNAAMKIAYGDVRLSVFQQWLAEFYTTLNRGLIKSVRPEQRSVSKDSSTASKNFSTGLP